MKPKDRSTLAELDTLLEDFLYAIRRIERRLSDPDEIHHPSIANLNQDLVVSRKHADDLLAKVNALANIDEIASAQTNDIPLNDDEINGLLNLNRHLKDVSTHLKAVSNDVTPRLEAKLADPADPMTDYEIEVEIAYVLREDDPEYDDNDDNYLTERYESAKREAFTVNDFNRTFSEAPWLGPHCYLLHDLYDRSYGQTKPALSLRDCLRIGRIYVDVQVWQQYYLDVITGKWEKSYRTDHNIANQGSD
jgi:hypothetical protein